MKSYEELSAENEALKSEIKSLADEKTKLEKLNDWYREQLKVKPDVILCGCKALAVFPQKDAESTAAKGLAYCNKLFEIEKDISEKSSEEIYTERQERSKPVAEAFFAWAEEQSSRILPKSLTGTAIQYALNQKTKLLRFLEDGMVELSNNRAERAIKPFVIGRKNWLFCNTPGGVGLILLQLFTALLKQPKKMGLNRLNI